MILMHCASSRSMASSTARLSFWTAALMAVTSHSINCAWTLR
jgi:hypothetical protein